MIDHLTRKKLEKIIKEEVKDIPHISQGGCGLFAYYLYVNLKKELPVILIAKPGTAGYYHVAIELYGIFIDSRKVCTDEELVIGYGDIPDLYKPICYKKLFKDIHGERWIWNKKFNYYHRHRLQKACFNISKRIRNELCR